MSNGYLRDWTGDHFGILDEGVLLAQHRLHESGLFTDEALARLLDEQPDVHLGISTMNEENGRWVWRDGDRGGLSGAELLDVLRTGHLWINVRRLLDVQPRYAALVDEIYADMEAANPKFKGNARSANLLISSPSARVLYHTDVRSTCCGTSAGGSGCGFTLISTTASSPNQSWKR